MQCEDEEGLEKRVGVEKEKHLPGVELKRWRDETCECYPPMDRVQKDMKLKHEKDFESITVIDVGDACLPTMTSKVVLQVLAFLSRIWAFPTLSSILLFKYRILYFSRQSTLTQLSILLSKRNLFTLPSILCYYFYFIFMFLFHNINHFIFFKVITL